MQIRFSRWFGRPPLGPPGQCGQDIYPAVRTILQIIDGLCLLIAASRIAQIAAGSGGDAARPTRPLAAAFQWFIRKPGCDRRWHARHLCAARGKFGGQPGLDGYPVRCRCRPVGPDEHGDRRDLISGLAKFFFEQGRRIGLGEKLGLEIKPW